MTEKITFAEAAKLGSTLLEPWAGGFLNPGRYQTATKGCLIGMAMKAVSVNSYQDAFPQLDDYIVKYPCHCRGYENDSMAKVIMHLFDDHVMQEIDVTRWTTDRVLQWAAKVERRFERKAEKEAAKTKKTAANEAVAITRA